MDDGDPATMNAGSGSLGDGEAMVNESGEGSGDETGERCVAGGALPEHAEEEGCEERRVDDGEDELKRVHDVVEVGDEVGGADREGYASYGGHAAHP